MDDLRERVEAVERALTDGEGDLAALAEGAATAERAEQLESDLADLESEIRDLQAATQALRGYVGNVRSVNERVEQRAETALSKVEALEADRQPPTDPRTTDQKPARRTDPDPGTSHDGATCEACGQPTDDASHDRHDDTTDHDRPAARTPNQQQASHATAGQSGYDRPSLDGFDPDPNPDVPDPLPQHDDPLTTDGGGADATVLSKIRDLV
ncbi:hypothetical protein ACKVMT_15265 [Halobacteriales archaeon Cl-PHB]